MNAAPSSLQSPPRAAGVLPVDALLRPLAAALARAPLPDAASALASELAEGLRCARVTVGVLEEERLRVVGQSSSAMAAAGQVAAGIAEAMQEAVDQQQPVACPSGAHDRITLAQRQLAGAGAVCSVPLVDGTRIVGAMTLERAT